MVHRQPYAFDKILIANRGEVALRVIRSARALGLRTVAVYSGADRDAPHVRAADEAIEIGAAAPSASYLAIDRLIAAARATGVDAVHPGYGFLAENAAFARACAANRIVFIGPSAEAIELMGNKAAAKRRMLEAGVPCVPGYEGAKQDDATLTREAQAIGFPIMVKAAAGGGGRGMRRVDTVAALAEALRAARAEARSAFGSDELILERALANARHVEVQIFGDRDGNVIHLGERDCSIQRRHQKIIEEAPSPAVTPELRAHLGAAAVTAARSVRYEGAGTAEFLLDNRSEFYFLEMNTRLQVEHAVTEEVTDLDLVAWQIRIAAGESLPLRQDDVKLRGHAIEARLYAEDPARGFLPQTGRVLAWAPPSSKGVRVEHALRVGLDITPHYDPMIAKIIAHGQTREQARRRLLQALADCVMLGVTTNRTFLLDCLAHERFADGSATTAFVESRLSARIAPEPADTRSLALAAVLLYRHASPGVPALLADWRSTGPAPVPLMLDDGGANLRADITALGGGRYRVSLSDRSHAVDVTADDDGRERFTVDGVAHEARYVFDRDVLHLAAGRVTMQVSDRMLAGVARADAAASDGRVLACMNGTVTAVPVRERERVKCGQTLAILEAMKMEHVIAAPVDGTVRRIAVSVGKAVANRELLMELESSSGK